MLGGTSTEDFNAFAPLFTTSIQSFRELKDASKFNKKM